MVVIVGKQGLIPGDGVAVGAVCLAVKQLKATLRFCVKCLFGFP